MSSRPTCVSAGCVVLFIGVLGCGGQPTSVNGKVNYNNLPVTGGIITLHFDGGKQVPGSIDGTGSFVVQNALTGKAKVTIDTESMKNVGGPKMPAMTKDAMAQMPAGGGTSSYMKIPPRYADPQKTTLEMVVQSGPQTKNFDLTDN